MSVGVVMRPAAGGKKRGPNGPQPPKKRDVSQSLCAKWEGPATTSPACLSVLEA